MAMRIDSLDFWTQIAHANNENWSVTAIWVIAMHWDLTARCIMAAYFYIDKMQTL
jgi:hypothetical protein